MHQSDQISSIYFPPKVTIFGQLVQEGHQNAIVPK